MQVLAVTLGWALGLAIAVAWLLAPAIGAQSSPLTKGPYITNPSSEAVTVIYEMAKPGDGFVRFGAGQAMDQKAPSVLYEKVGYAILPTEEAESKEGKKRLVNGIISGPNTAYLYRARLTGLKPGTEYRYEVVPAAGLAPLGPYTMRTFPTTTERISFIMYGDCRGNPTTHRALAAKFERHNPLFIVNSGDLVDCGYVYSQWGEQFFTPLADVIDHIPILGGYGNHERDQASLLHFFDTSTSQTWYSFDCGPVHVVVLDYTKAKEEVLKWLEADLAAAKAPWKIAAYHVPSFSYEGHHRTDTNRTRFLPLFEKYGVDVVVTGHAHLYERFKPLERMDPLPASAAGQGGVAAGSSGAPRHPITFLISGGAGAPMIGSAMGPAKINPKPPFLVKTALVNHYCVFTVDAESLRMQALTAEGKEIDSFTIKKTAGRYDDAYLAQAQPMEQAMLAMAIIPREEPSRMEIDPLPSLEKPGEVKLTLRFRGLATPVSVSVQLAEMSRAAYAMDPVTLEAKPEQESKVSFKVRALKPVSTREEKDGSGQVIAQTLIPELRLFVTGKCGNREASYVTSPLQNGIVVTD